MLDPAIPGCPYDGYQSPSRSSRTLCLKGCNSNSDCRTGEGYECANPLGPPWDALILDDNQNQKVCMATQTVDAGMSVDSGDAPVCQVQGPIVPPIVEGGADASPDAALDGPTGG
jgi:hypothetical protein